jgi:hypothetical protein
MGPPIYASAPTADGRWYAVRLHPNGRISGVIPGLFDSKAAADSNAKREVGLAN